MFYVESTLKGKDWGMSEEGGFGLTIAEKFFGLILLVVGALATYYTFTSAQALDVHTGFFGFLREQPNVSTKAKLPATDR